jgi:hypothetical protein
MSMGKLLGVATYLSLECVSARNKPFWLLQLTGLGNSLEEADLSPTEPCLLADGDKFGVLLLALAVETIEVEDDEDRQTDPQ